ncbi:putative leader peptide [Streptomyces gamaensis]|uniref:Leader peptide n=1 Tax=Streptomyces gamaensis TaxID=1763542 RepID=A0ABW0YUD5_9ACTN
MPSAGVALISRRHVDLGRVSSAICRAPRALCPAH